MIIVNYVLILWLICTSTVPIMSASYYYFSDMRKFCNNYYKPKDSFINDTDLLDIEICDTYLSDNFLYKKYNNCINESYCIEKDYEITTVDFSYRISGETLTDYKEIVKELKKYIIKEDIYKISVLNISTITFISSLSLFLINILFIILSQYFLFHTRSRQITPSMYSLMF